MNRPWGWVGEGCSKTSKGEQRGRGGSKIGNLEQTYFLNVPKVIRSEECVTQHKLWVADKIDGCSPKFHIVPPKGKEWKIRDLTL